MTEANQWKASELVSLAGLFTGIVGTLVGAFLGVQVGAQGKDAAEKQTVLADKRATKAEARADNAEQKFMRAFMALPADQQQKFSK
ncbi:hypothetical protein BEN49_20325 [Hymenobacter coccineus]|uniref:Uncharacterized protein n=2 Tax=Hymenobacter coccineus TaxID=1908235 RepID=A0A1G1TKB5_9BACT|nr:hypothetical protein BEN49_20325 [Hymenobacter coccineus]